MKTSKIFIWLLAIGIVLLTLTFVFPSDGITIAKSTLRFEHNDFDSIKSQVDYIITDIHLDSLFEKFNTSSEPFDSVAYIDSITKTLAIQDSIRKTEERTTAQQNYLSHIINSISPIVFPLDSDSLINFKYFDQLFSQLNSADSLAINIAHYGDSQIEEDRITLTLRRHLQEKFGGLGIGLISTFPLIGSRTVAQNTTPEPKRYALWGKKSLRRTENNHYGPIGHTAVLNDNKISINLVPRQQKGSIYSAQQCSQLTLITLPQDTIDLTYNGKYSCIKKENDLIQFNTYQLQDSTTRLRLTLQGNGDIYGLRLHGKTGVTVDNIAMRGSSGTIFTNNNPQQLAAYFKHTNTQLIIMQFGGNSMPFTRTKQGIDEYITRLVKQVEFMHNQAPQAAILFIGPSDMPTRINGKMQTYPMIPYFDKQMSAAMQKRGFAYWSMFQAMGGEGTMLEWINKGWAANDFIHFSGRGASIIGEELFKAIMEEYDFYLQRQARQQND